MLKNPDSSNLCHHVQFCSIGQILLLSNFFIKEPLDIYKRIWHTTALSK